MSDQQTEAAREYIDALTAERDALRSVVRHWNRSEFMDGDLWISDQGAFGTHEIVDEITPAERDAIRAAMEADTR